MPGDHSSEEQPLTTTETAASASHLQQSPSSHKRRRSEGASGGDARRRTASPSPSKSNDAVADPETVNPPLPDEEAPPLPDEAPPADDGWDALWDANAQAYYFYNRFTQLSQWENPRVPETTATGYGSYDRYASSAAPGTASSSGAPGTSSPPKRRAGGYNPAIHGNYDPNADYAKEIEQEEEDEHAASVAAAAGVMDPSQDYTATGHFNRFTGRFQNDSINPDNHNDENKSRRQMSAFFDVDAAANSHDGRSLKEERRKKNLSKKELKAFQAKRKERKEEKRRAWLRD